ncbi:MAG: hypothetical protein ACTSVV_03485, partial [Promethearchaeota archaeon]
QELYRRLKFNHDFQAKIEKKETSYRIIKILKKVSDHLNIIPDVRKRAIYLYNKIVKNAIKWRLKIPNHVSLIATCLFLASREFSSQAPITIYEICNTFVNFGHRVRCRMIIRDILKFKRNLGLKRINHKSSDYLDRLLNKLYYDREFNIRFKKKSSAINLNCYIRLLKQFATEILNRIPYNIKSSRNPFILAGASIYGADVIISKKKRQKRILTQKILSGATGIAEYSIRDHYCTVIKGFIISEFNIKSNQKME